MTPITFLDNFYRVPKVISFAINEDPNLKLIYRAPKEVVKSEKEQKTLAVDEILKIVRVMVGLGSNHVHLSCDTIEGDIDLPHLIKQLKRLDQIQEVSLSTYGFDLNRFVSELRESELDNLTINVDTLRPGRFSKITGTEQLPSVLAGIDAAFRSKFSSLNLSVVVMRGVNADELFEFVSLIQDENARILFNEVIPFSQTGWVSTAIMPKEEILQNLLSQLPLVADKSRCCEGYHYKIVDHIGTITLVPSLSETHCDSCSTVRFSVGGGIQSCQFSEPEFDVIDGIRNGIGHDELESRARKTLLKKPAGRPGREDLVSLSKR